MIYFLWTCPKSMSTLFERIIMNISEKSTQQILCIHEPFSIPYYFGCDRISKRYDSSPSYTNAYKNTNFESVLWDLLKKGESESKVFVKDMAYHIFSYIQKSENFNQIINELKKHKHAFLIRNPKTTITSLYEFIKNNNFDGWNYFDENECGYYDVYEMSKLFDGSIFLSENVYLNISSICDYIGVPYQSEFEYWNKLSNNIPEDWLVWKEWHIDVIESTCIHKNKNNKVIPYYSEIQDTLYKNESYYLSILFD